MFSDSCAGQAKFSLAQFTFSLQFNFIHNSLVHDPAPLEMYKREPNCTEVILHNLLRVLEVNSKTLPMVLESGYNLTKLTTLYLFFNTGMLKIPQNVQKIREITFQHKKKCNLTRQCMYCLPQRLKSMFFGNFSNGTALNTV